MEQNYKKICADFLRGLPERTKDVVERRFGLKGEERATLESIGKIYSITRERVRQIETEGLYEIREIAKGRKDVFENFRGVLKKYGGLKKEDVLLAELGGGKSENHVFLLLNLSDQVERFSEDEDFHTFWQDRGKGAFPLAKEAINSSLKYLEEKKAALTGDELYQAGKRKNRFDKNSFLSFLEISRRIQKNPEGKFGLLGWIDINPKGVKDKAYLVLRKEAKPLHFTEIVGLIEKMPFNYQKKIHVATVHNELIRDQRFVLVGRGLYALRDWGYVPGVVKDVITNILRDSKKPLSKEEICEKVLKQRFVKENTISLNLQDRRCFAKDPEGRYKINSVNAA